MVPSDERTRATVGLSDHLTLSLVAGKHHQVVFGCRRAAGQRELQPELVVEAEAGQEGVGGEGRVAELVVSAEPRSGDVDGCGTNETRVHVKGRNCRIYRLFRQSPKDGTVAAQFTTLNSVFLSPPVDATA